MAAVVTLLFTDLVGSTELLDRLGDDAGEQVRRTHFRLLREAVIAAGGQEVKNLGDGLMMAFDSAVAAVEGAVAIQLAIERHNRGRAAQPLAVRVGLHVGEPIRDEDDYFGTPVVVAKRLCDSADGGQIRASELVRGLVGTRGGFDFSPIGPVELKGLAEPVVAHEVRWVPEPVPGRRASPASPSDPRALRLVGRERELELLEAELGVAASGRLRVVLLVGDAGIGKTRLGNELVARHASEVVALSARAYPLGATASLGLWVEALERHLRTLEPEEVATLCRADAADLAALLPSVATAGGDRPASEPPRIRLLGALANLFARLAADGPVVILLDDVHLADGSSWEALNYLTRNLADHPLLLVLAARPVELAAQAMASEMLLGLEQEGLLLRSHLGALSADELRELTEGFPGVERAGNALIEWLMERSQGSPLFATGLLRALVEEGADLSRPELRVLPEDLADRVGVHLRELDAASRAVLEMVAVVGYRVGFTELVSLCGQPFDRLADILDGLVGNHFLAEEAHGRDLPYEVAHPLYAEAVYRAIGGARRRALHRHVAQTLVAAGRPGPAATHFVASSDVGDPEAIDALRDALAQAEARQLHREALALLDALLQLLPAGDRRWLEISDALAEQPEWIVDHRADVGAKTGIAAMRRIDQLLTKSADPVRRGSVKLNLATLLAWDAGDLEAARPLAEEARRLFAEARETRRELLAWNELGYVAGWLGGDAEFHEATADEVLSAAEAVGDRSVLLQALCSQAHALGGGRGDLTRSLGVIARAMAVAREDGRLYRLSYLLAQEAWTFAWLGRMADAHRRIDEAKEANPAFRDTLLLDWAGQLHWLEADFAAVAAAFREQRAWDGAPSRRRAMGAVAAAICAAEAGDAPAAEAILQPAAAVFGGRDWAIWSDLVRWGAGVVAWSVGDAPAATASLAHAARRQVACGWGTGPCGRVMLADLAEVAGHTSDTEAAALTLDLLDASDPDPEDGSLAALTLLARGGAALAQGAAKEATTLLDESAGRLAQAGWPLFQGRALALQGRARAAGGDADGALDALRRSAEIFDACGAVVRRGWVAQDMRRLGARGRRAVNAVAGPAALTKREREVARLAVEGHSAKEIAAALFIGERTVETHLAGAYAKLGVSSRVELVRLAGTLEL